eukprot:1305215-Rhodomonas_salina.1
MSGTEKGCPVLTPAMVLRDDLAWAVRVWCADSLNAALDSASLQRATITEVTQPWTLLDPKLRH